jgi:hypothetical protein
LFARHIGPPAKGPRYRPLRNPSKGQNPSGESACFGYSTTCGYFWSYDFSLRAEFIGVWLDENRLTQHNGDLLGRLVSINADKWERQELREVIESGADLLNVKFEDEFIEHALVGDRVQSRVAAWPHQSAEVTRRRVRQEAPVQFGHQRPADERHAAGGSG